MISHVANAFRGFPGNLWDTPAIHDYFNRFNEIKNSLEKLFDYKIISTDYSDIIDYNEYCITDLGERTHHYSVGKCLSGILAFDTTSKRFVVFHFMHEFDFYSLNVMKLEAFLPSRIENTMVNILNYEYEQFNLNILSRINLETVDFELSKLVIFSNIIPTYDLMHYFTRQHSNVELWRIGVINDDITFVEKIRNDLIESR
jgi:hypothetical protein